jgi:hypothetical protein
MNAFPTPLNPDEERLGQLAMRFRGAESDGDRHAIANDYARTLKNLLGSDLAFVPELEDQLPDEFMPPEFHARVGVPRS